ncbi:MAG: rane protein, partial [Frankiales bacterium]|nr:rane protein [Frankiales bacterium]
RLGAVAVTAAACANLAAGRLTFAAGMVPALAALVLLRRGRPGAAAAAGALSGLISPLAAFAELTALAGLFLSGRPRRPLLLTGLVTAVPVGVVSLLFGQPSRMPFDPWAAFGIVITCVAVAVLQVPAAVRAVAGITAVLAVAAWAIPSPIGVNVGRLPMLLAAPLVLATVRKDGPVVRVVVLGLLAWPMTNLGHELAIAASPSSSAAYYAPLLRHLPAAGTATQRLELVDTRSHGGSFYLAGQVPLARGWERQVDVAKNPLFYAPALSATAYRSWLQSHAVGWVALSSADPDYGARTEADLVRRGLPYLEPVWHDADWRLFRVTVPAPAATGGLTVTALQDSAVQLTSTGSARGVVRVAYSRLLAVHAEGDPLRRGCLEPSPTGDTVVTVPTAGRWTIEADVGQLLVDCRPGREGVRRALLRRAGAP